MTSLPERIAIELINTVKSEIERGTQHYDIHGKRLFTVKEVLEALERDKRVEIQKP